MFEKKALPIWYARAWLPHYVGMHHTSKSFIYMNL
jgi:hypothetical protein